MVRSYEELVGGLGRAVNFRAQRVLVKELLSYNATKLIIGGEEYTLRDVSMNGLSFFAPKDSTDWVIDAVPEITVLVHDLPAYRGPARVARTERTPRRLLVGLQLVKGFLDLPDIQRKNEEQKLKKDLSDGPDLVRKHVPPAYRDAVEHAVHFLQYYRRCLVHHEERYAELGEGGQLGIEQMIRKALRAIRGPWNEFTRSAAKIAYPHFGDPEVRKAMKEYTEAMITPLLMGVPVLHRAYSKPLGYPGDYQTMMYIYRNGLEGANAFDKVMNKLSCEEPLAAGVRTRKDVMLKIHEEEHERFLATRSSEDTFRVSSLGAGPAREVLEFVTARGVWPKHIHWTLIDQEEEALSLAYHDIYREIAGASAPGTLRCMFMSFVQFLTDPHSMLADEPQHLIYSVGLFDYLTERRAQFLIRNLYEKLVPGGLLTIGNALGPNFHAWTTEYVLDWTLVYRSESDMLELAKKIPDPAEVKVIPEPSGGYYMLLIRKP